MRIAVAAALPLGEELHLALGQELHLAPPRGEELHLSPKSHPGQITPITRQTVSLFHLAEDREPDPTTTTLVAAPASTSKDRQRRRRHRCHVTGPGMGKNVGPVWLAHFRITT